MKSTKERLEQTYCRPTNDKEWAIVAGHSETHPQNKIDFPFVRNWAWDTEAPYPIDIKNNMTMATSEEVVGKTEIPSQHFSDLVHDRIVPWRLEEDGFVKENPLEIDGVVFKVPYKEDYTFSSPNKTGVIISIRFEHGMYLGTCIFTIHAHPHHVINLSGIKTYTQLLNLIEMIG